MTKSLYPSPWRRVASVVCNLLAGWSLFTLTLILWLDPTDVARLPDGSTSGMWVLALASALGALVFAALAFVLIRERRFGPLLFASGLLSLVSLVLLQLGRSGFRAHAVDGAPIPPELFDRWWLGVPVLALQLVIGGLLMWRRRTS